MGCSRQRSPVRLRPPPSPLDAGEAKAWAAEKDIAVVRLLVIVFNVGMWYLVLPQTGGVPWLALTISVAATAYAVAVVLLRPYERFPIMRAALFTAITDGVLITLWLHATGGAHSPFYLLWYLSLIAVTFRYEWRATVFASCLYIVGYVGLLALRNEMLANAGMVSVRITYLALTGAVGAMLAHESAQVFQARGRLERQISEERRERQQAELERLRGIDRFKTEFINAAAHELNTPLTPLRLQLHNLRHAPGADRARALQVMERNVERLSLLVQDMLDAARLQGGHLNVRGQDVDLAVLVRDAVETYQGQADAKSMRIHVEGPETLEMPLDGKRVGQILFNLLSNAIKYSPPGAQVQVRYARGPPRRCRPRSCGRCLRCRGPPRAAGGCFKGEGCDGEACSGPRAPTLRSRHLPGRGR